MPRPHKTTQMSTFHPRNLHREGYDFDRLTKAYPPLRAHVIRNPAGEPTISFSDPEAVKALNTALLIGHYGLQHWDIPEGYLCPPVPGRADYLHHLADLLAAGGPLLTGKNIRILDIGTGANLIYAILGQRIYDWSMVGTEVDPLALKTAKALIETIRYCKTASGCGSRKIAVSFWKASSVSRTSSMPPFAIHLFTPLKQRQPRLTPANGRISSSER